MHAEPPRPEAATTSPAPPPARPDDVAFVPPLDAGMPPLECDLWTQRCAAGSKCMPYATMGGSWDGTRCSPLAEEPAGVDEPCRVIDGGASGLDDCDLASMCWDVDPETNAGTCVPFCVGNPSQPLCESPDRYCAQAAGGVLNICLPTCDPLAQGCRQGLGCYGASTDAFVCMPDASVGSGILNVPCEFVNVCAPGFQCSSGDGHPCPPDSAACCRPFCDVDEPAPPCSPFEECVPWFQAGRAPAGLEDVGTCAFPEL